MTTANETPRQILWRLIKDIKFSMFTTVGSNGDMRAAPMTTQNTDLDENDTLWFFMSRKDDVVADIGSHPNVNVSYADKGDDCYVSVSGIASVVEDMAKKNHLWNSFAQAWFPGGVDDPELALVQVKIVHAHYWDVKESKMIQLFKIAKASLTGEKVEKMGQVGEVTM